MSSSQSPFCKPVLCSINWSWGQSKYWQNLVRRLWNVNFPWGYSNLLNLMANEDNPGMDLPTNCPHRQSWGWVDTPMDPQWTSISSASTLWASYPWMENLSALTLVGQLEDHILSPKLKSCGDWFVLQNLFTDCESICESWVHTYL